MGVHSSRGYAEMPRGAISCLGNNGLRQYRLQHISTRFIAPVYGVANVSYMCVRPKRKKNENEGRRKKSVTN